MQTIVGKGVLVHVYYGTMMLWYSIQRLMVVVVCVGGWCSLGRVDLPGQTADSLFLIFDGFPVDCAGALWGPVAPSRAHVAMCNVCLLIHVALSLHPHQHACV